MRIRRTVHEPRIELIPLIDVMMFLLSFFIYSQALAVRISVVPMELRKFQSAQAAKPVPAATISITLDGKLYYNRVPCELSDIAGRVAESKSEDTKTVVYIAVADGQGTVDRAPIMQSVWDKLRGCGLQVNFVGRPIDTDEKNPATAPTTPTAPTTLTAPTAPTTKP
ncbi:MAG: biopolymer transporter ExbD [Planctomycetota bacterium]|nr:biopolymer transporter ExbD [Planctomycetota bacterium]MDA1262928.1 biopolymer transporter ExbD [Planctomycetota bacterium]